MQSQGEPDYAGVAVRLMAGVPIAIVLAFAWLALFKAIGWQGESAATAYKVLVFTPAIVVPIWWAIIYCVRGH